MHPGMTVRTLKRVRKYAASSEPRYDSLVLGGSRPMRLDSFHNDPEMIRSCVRSAGLSTGAAGVRQPPARQRRSPVDPLVTRDVTDVRVVYELRLWYEGRLAGGNDEHCGAGRDIADSVGNLPLRSLP